MKFLLSLFAFVTFATAVFWLQGPEPTLGPDHVIYLTLANQVIERQPSGHYFHEWNSVRSLAVLLAYAHKVTGSHILSLKIILFINTLFFLFAYELFASSYIKDFAHLLLFTLLSGMAVSFGVASWGVSDYAALLPRTLAMPGILFCFWIFFRFQTDARRYLAFPLLVLFSILHLSTFHAFGVLIWMELLEWLFVDRCRLSSRLALLPISLVASFCILLGLQASGASINATGFIEWAISPIQSQKRSSPNTAHNLPASAASAKASQNAQHSVSSAISAASQQAPQKPTSTEAPPAPSQTAPGASTLSAASDLPYTPAIAWENELAIRRWRNMPLAFVNVANILASYSLIAALTLVGMYEAWRRGFSLWDKYMGLFFLAILCGALGLQTLEWFLRGFCSFYPINFEEIRSLSFIMIPSLYFVYTLFRFGLPAFALAPSKWTRVGICLLAIAMPLSMKSLTAEIRGKILDAFCWAGILNTSDDSAVQNARLALGLARGARYYYDSRKVATWLNKNLPKTAIVMTDRDDLLGEGFNVIGTRQQAAITNPGRNPGWVNSVSLKCDKAMATRSSAEIVATARNVGANYAIVDWPEPHALYSDMHFSVLEVP